MEDWDKELAAWTLKGKPTYYFTCKKCNSHGSVPEIPSNEHSLNKAKTQGLCFLCQSNEEVIAVQEVDPNGFEAGKPGAKLDFGKVPVMRGAIRYFPRALSCVAAISDKGARKYTWKGWEDVPDGENRYADARGRHELAIGRGELIDDSPGGTGELHLGQVAWNALAELELVLRRLEKDNNGKTNK